MDINEFSSVRLAFARTGLLGTQRIDGGSIHISGYTQWGGGTDLLDSIRVQLSGKINQLQLFTLSDRMIALSGDINAGFTGRKLTLRSGLLVNRAPIELPDSSAPTLGDDVVILPSRKQRTAEQAQTGSAIGCAIHPATICHATICRNTSNPHSSKHRRPCFG